MRGKVYARAILWIAENDDTEWLPSADFLKQFTPESFLESDVSPSVTACLVADVFNTTTLQVARDVRKRLNAR